MTPIECLHYAMNLPTSVVINGCDSLERLEQGLQAARTFRPLTQKELDHSTARTAAAGRDGQFEPFKTTRSSMAPLTTPMVGVGLQAVTFRRTWRRDGSEAEWYELRCRNSRGKAP